METLLDPARWDDQPGEPDQTEGLVLLVDVTTSPEDLTSSLRCWTEMLQDNPGATLDPDEENIYLGAQGISGEGYRIRGAPAKLGGAG